MKTLYFYLSILLFAVISCNRQDDEVTQKADAVDVYIAGSENNEACFWKNSIKTILQNGTGLTATQIITENNNMYVRGYDQSNTNLQFFWKNGVKTSINQYLNIPSSVESSIQGFTVKNGDIYFSGYEENPIPASPSEKYQICYWKNGVKTILIKSPFTANVPAIFVDGSDVYVSIDYYSLVSQNVEGAYFKNLILYPISQANHTYNFAKNSSGIYLLYQKNMKFYTKNVLNNADMLIGDYTSTISGGKIVSDSYNFDLYTTYNGWGNFYYKNSSANTPTYDPNYEIRDLFSLNNNLYLIKNNVGPAGYSAKIFINGIQVQSITSNTNGTPYYTGLFNSIFVAEN